MYYCNQIDTTWNLQLVIINIAKMSRRNDEQFKKLILQIKKIWSIHVFLFYKTWT